MDSGFLDFTDVHSFSIPSVPFSAPIAGESLEELAIAAYKVCTDFYGNQPFVVTNMCSELVWPPDPSVPKYSATIYALSHG